jgi:hypothetical protein
MSTEIPARPTADLRAVTTGTKDAGFESMMSATPASPLWASQRAYPCLYPYAELEFAGQDGAVAASSRSYPQGWSHVTHCCARAAGRPQLFGTVLECCEVVVRVGGSPCKSRLPLEKMSRQVVQLQQLVCCSDWIRRRLPCWRMFHRQRSRTSNGATVFATIRSTPFCPQFVAGARPCALIATVLHPLRSIFTSPRQSIGSLARQLGNG